MSWESSAHYYRLINEGVRARLGGVASAPLILHSFDFGQIAAMQAAGEWTALRQSLADAARGLHAAGAEGLLIATNTMHKLADAVTEAAPIPLLHIADPLANALVEAGHRRVGLMGTRFTMNETFYAERLAAKGLEVILPQAADREIIDRVIYDELCAGVVRDESRAAYSAAIGDMAGRGADAVALACTEIMMLVGEGDSCLPIFDTTALHAAAAVDFVGS